MKALVVVGTTMSKRFWDTGVLKVIKGEDICMDKGTGLGVSRKTAYCSELWLDLYRVWKQSKKPPVCAVKCVYKQCTGDALRIINNLRKD